MKTPLALALVLAWIVCGFTVEPCHAQQHRAVRLGNPSTRFAPPLKTSQDLRNLFSNEKLRPDIESILKQVNWQGNVDDLYKAAATAEIREHKIPVGTRMPFMSARKNGQPVALVDVLWAGDKPADAYAFDFRSKGRRYQCITPKACSNFYLEDLGPERLTIALTKTLPPEVSMCEPFEMSVTVRNTSSQALTNVRVTDNLPDGWQTTTGKKTLDLAAGDLKPGEGMQFKVQLTASSPGHYENRARVSTAEGANAEALAATRVQAPALEMVCTAPPQAQVRRPFNVCLSLKNTGTVAERKATLLLSIPRGVTVVNTTAGGAVSENNVSWEVQDLAPGTIREVCASLTATEPGQLRFASKAQGLCAPATETACETKLVGVAGILLEVVDLEDPVQVGDNVTYEIRVVNQGSAPLANIKLSCEVPEQQEFVSGEGATQVSASGRSIAMSTLPLLEPRNTVSWRVVVKAIAPGDVRFKTDLRSDEFAVPIQEFEATQQY